jgi:hypothetical protein
VGTRGPIGSHTPRRVRLKFRGKFVGIE